MKNLGFGSCERKISLNSPSESEKSRFSLIFLLLLLLKSSEDSWNLFPSFTGSVSQGMNDFPANQDEGIPKNWGILSRSLSQLEFYSCESRRLHFPWNLIPSVDFPGIWEFKACQIRWDFRTERRKFQGKKSVTGSLGALGSHLKIWDKYSM